MTLDDCIVHLQVLSHAPDLPMSDRVVIEFAVNVLRSIPPDEAKARANATSIAQASAAIESILNDAFSSRRPPLPGSVLVATLSALVPVSAALGHRPPEALIAAVARYSPGFRDVLNALAPAKAAVPL